jgi:hypothetical protein
MVAVSMKIFRKCTTILLRLILTARRKWVAAGVIPDHKRAWFPPGILSPAEAI